ncbi:MAG: hypothetical protein HY882_16165 [Deltaproteobacteria bacterium]|nr:hypothetical protein [Deltaproteobacteria bacterium]
MPLVKKSKNSIWRIWTGPWKVGGKNYKKEIGFVVAVNIRTDKLPPDVNYIQIKESIIDQIERIVAEFDK